MNRGKGKCERKIATPKEANGPGPSDAPEFVESTPAREIALLQKEISRLNEAQDHAMDEVKARAAEYKHLKDEIEKNAAHQKRLADPEKISNEAQQAKLAGQVLQKSLRTRKEEMDITLKKVNELRIDRLEKVNELRIARLAAGNARAYAGCLENQGALQAVEDSETSRMEERSRPQIAVFRPTDANCRRSSKSPDRGPRRSKSPEGIAERRSSKSPERRPRRSKSPERIAIKRISESPDRSPRTFSEREAGP